MDPERSGPFGHVCSRFPEGGADPDRSRLQSRSPLLLTSSSSNSRVRPLSPSPSETPGLPSPRQAGSGPAPFRLPRGPWSQPVCPSPIPCSSFLKPPSVLPLPCFLLPIPQRIPYLSQGTLDSPSSIPVRVTYAPLPPYSLTLLCIPSFLLWICTSPQYSPSESLSALRHARLSVFFLSLLR